MSQGTTHQALYRRWRAQTFSEMVGQEAVVATLRNAVATNQVAHGLLFTGPRGTGKTSLARIVAKAINCLAIGPTADPCDACVNCTAIREGRALDLVEIDAASNRGIDAIRALRERLEYSPTDLKRKVYILDEAHQITKDAWNALLKSLEEPPDFVTFMFASTHPQEFPPAILSRLQRFDVRRLTVPEITGKLERILVADGREADPEAVALVARLAAGGMRDAESILDQLLSSTGGRIEAEAVRDLLGLANADIVEGFVAALADGDAGTGIALLDRLDERGRDLRIFLDQVVDMLREQLVAGLGAGSAGDPTLAGAARRLASIDPTRLGPGGLRLQLELALLESHIASSAASVTAGRSPGAASPSPDARPARASRPVPEATTPPLEAATLPPGAHGSISPSAAAGSAPAVETTREPVSPPPTSSPATAPAGDDLERVRTGWAALMATATPALRALLVECRPVIVEGSTVTLGFPEEKPFMQGHAERSRAKLEAHFGVFLGHEVAIRCVTSNLDLLPPLPADAEAAHILSEAHRIFADDLAEAPEVT